MSTDDLVSTKELASKLKVTEPLLKKLLKDFGIETQRVDRRAHLDTQASTTVKEILALRASGKKNSEIKEMFDASKKTTSPKVKEETLTETKEEAKEEAKEEKPKKKPLKKVLKKKTDPKTKKVKKEIESDEKAEEASTDTEKKNLKSEKPTKNKIRKESPQAKIELDEELEADEETDEGSVMDISGYLHEDEEEDNELKALLSIEEGDEEISSLDDDDDIEEVEQIQETTDETLSPRKIRRRQFSFKYIQRQIANDSKRVNYIKQKLNRGRISEKEKMILEDSLSKRAVLLSGWIQLLRWVKN